MKWNYDELVRPTQMLIDKAVKSIRRGSSNLDTDVFNKLMGRPILDSSGKPVIGDDGKQKRHKFNLREYNVTEKGLRTYLRNRRDNEDTLTELYESEDGLVSKFSEGRQQIRLKYAKDDINSIRHSLRPEVITPTQLALEHKEELVTRLRYLLTNPQTETGEYAFEKPFNEKDNTLMNKLIDILLEDDSEPTMGTMQATPFIDETIKAITNFDMQSKQQRQNFYDYWEEKDKLFENFATAAFGVQGVVEDLNLDSIDDEMQRQVAEYNKIMGLRPEVEEKVEEKVEEITGTLAEFKKNLKGLKIPNYIIKFNSIPMSQLKDDALITELVRKYLKTIGHHEMPESLKISETGDEQPKVHAQLDAEKPQNVQERSSIESPGEVTAAQAQAEETEKRYDDIKVDPLFAMVVKSDNSKLEYLYTDATIDKAREKIKNTLKQGRDALFLEAMSAFDVHITKFLDKYRDAQEITNQEGNEFHLHIMDESTNVNILDSLGIRGGFVVEWIEWTGEPDSRPFDNYADAVNFINKHTKNFFKVLHQMLIISPSIYAVSGLPKRSKVKGTGQRLYQRALEGGTLQDFTSQLPVVDENVMKDLQDTIQNVRDYYITPFESKYVFNKDKPDFYEDKTFEDIRVFIRDDPVQMVLTSMLDPERGDPNISPEDLEHMSKAITHLDRGSMNVLDTDTRNRWLKFINGYTNLFQGVGTDSQKYLKLRDDAKAVVGSILYDIGMNSMSEDDLAKEKFKNRLLTYWKEQQEESNLELANVIGLLVSRPFKKYIERKDNEDLTQQYSILKATISRVNWVKFTGPITYAMLDAKDLLLKMKGEQVYKGTMDLYDADDISYIIDLIQKENKIDLYATDIEKIVKHEGAFNTVATDMGLNEDIIYKVKGMFR